MPYASPPTNPDALQRLPSPPGEAPLRPFLDALLPEMQEGVLLLEGPPAFRIVYANAALTRALDQPEGFLAGRPPEAVLPPEAVAHLRAHFACPDAAPPFRGPLALQIPEGVARAVPCSATLLPADGAARAHLLCVFHLHAALPPLLPAAPGPTFHEVAASVAVLIWAAGPDGTCTYLNHGWHAYTGRSPEDDLGGRWLEAIHPHDRVACLERYGRAVAHQEAFELEYRLRRHDGQYRWFLVQGVPCHKRDGSFAGFVGALLDIHGRRRTEDSIRRSAARLEVLHDIDRAILQAHASRDIATAALARLQALTGCDRGSICLIDEDARVMNVLAVVDDNPARPGAGQQIPLSLFGDLDPFPKQDIYFLPDAEAAPERLPIHARLDGLRTMLSVPLITQEERIGLLNLASSRPNAFSFDQIDLARETASLLSIALHSSRLYEAVEEARGRLEQLSRRLVEVQEAERRHLALELHDEVGQLLTMTRLALEGVSGIDRDGAARLAQAQRLLASLTDKVRALSLDLRPTLLDDLGLLPALQWHVECFQADTGIEVAFRQAGLQGWRCAAATETAAYRIVQEALTNTARHAGVDRVAVTALRQGNLLHLRIEDRGCGFTLSAPPGHAYTGGLSGLAERASLLGGHLDVETSPGAGTVVLATLPTDPADARRRP